MLQQYTLTQLSQLGELYSEAYLFAKSVGDIDWEYPFPEEKLQTFINNGELYGLNDNPGEVSSAVRLYENGQTNNQILHVGKLVTAQSVKGTGFTKHRLLPAIVKTANHMHKDELRLTCLAHNSRLRNFYTSLGFQAIAERDAQADTGSIVRVSEMSLIVTDDIR